ncbi:hypothetical protein PMLGA01_010012900 [Plasmodium malariae]|uniref:Uncharacterized protein n=1 Tax=Plasmodium malariae TaxID=5858 RepID=A0A1C3KL58_PLAMA|nr:hypothetical protein PMLGA01_010012900 [Plasmodium malariae]
MNGSFTFVKKQIREFLNYWTNLLQSSFLSLKMYTHKCKKLKRYIEIYKKEIKERKKKQCFVVLLVHSKKKKKKVHLNNLYLKYTIERKFYLFKKYFVILINIYFYNNHLRLCEQTIQSRRETRILNGCLTKWMSYKIYCKENYFLQDLCNDFLSYRRKSEFLILLKQFYIENKWKNYCEYNSLMFYKSIQEKTFIRVLKHWIDKTRIYFEKKKKKDNFKYKYHMNLVKKYFFLFIFAVNKLKIEKKNFDIVRFKKEKTLKQKVLTTLYNIALTRLGTYETIIKLSNRKSENNLLKKYYHALFHFVRKKKFLKNGTHQIQNMTNNSLLKKYFYIYIFKYVSSISHYKYYYYNKYLSIWKYYVVMKKKDDSFAHTEEEEVDEEEVDEEEVDEEEEEDKEDEDKEDEDKEEEDKEEEDKEEEDKEEEDKEEEDKEEEDKEEEEVDENELDAGNVSKRSKSGVCAFFRQHNDNMSDDSSRYTLRFKDHSNKSGEENVKDDDYIDENIDSIISYIASSETKDDSDSSDSVELSKIKL